MSKLDQMSIFQYFKRVSEYGIYFYEINSEISGTYYLKLKQITIKLMDRFSLSVCYR